MEPVMVQSGESTPKSPPRIIAGFGRSGTTWVQDVVAQSNSLRTVFEPLHPGAIPGAREYAYLYCDAGDECAGLHEFLKEYFEGDFKSVWANYRIRTPWLYPQPGDLLSLSKIQKRLRRWKQAKNYILLYKEQLDYKERLIKLIRANMMLPWIKAQFDARIVFMIRHPAAVVLSQLSSPDSWDPYQQIEVYRKDSSLIEKVDGRMRDLLFQRLDKTEALTLSWCVENSIALRHAEEHGILVVHYEELIRNGHPEWQRLLNALDLENFPSDEQISRPSQQAWGERAADPKLVSKYAAWMNRIDSDTTSAIQKILDATGMVLYRTDQALSASKK
jgi:hypothetical protein